MSVEKPCFRRALPCQSQFSSHCRGLQPLLVGLPAKVFRIASSCRQTLHAPIAAGVQDVPPVAIVMCFHPSLFDLLFTCTNTQHVGPVTMTQHRIRREVSNFLIGWKCVQMRWSNLNNPECMHGLHKHSDMNTCSIGRNACSSGPSHWLKLSVIRICYLARLAFHSFLGLQVPMQLKGRYSLLEWTSEVTGMPQISFVSKENHGIVGQKGATTIPMAST